MRRFILALALLTASIVGGGPAVGQGFSCNSFADIAGNYSGVGFGYSEGISASTFSFLAINNAGQYAVAFYASGFGKNRDDTPVGVSSVTGFSTGALQIVSASTCMLIGTIDGDSETFVAKFVDGGNMILASSPFDPTVQTLEVFWRD